MASGPPAWYGAAAMNVSSESLYSPSASLSTSPARPRAAQVLLSSSASSSQLAGVELVIGTKLEAGPEQAAEQHHHGKSQPQREKEEGEGQVELRGEELAGRPKVTALSTPESAVLQLHLSRGSPLPTRRKNTSSASSSVSSSSCSAFPIIRGASPLSSSSPAVGGEVESSSSSNNLNPEHQAQPALSPRGSASSRPQLHLQQVAHLNAHLQAHHTAASSHVEFIEPLPQLPSSPTMEEVKHRQHAQFLALARVMKGDSFDSIDSVDNGVSPPTSPRGFLAISTGSGRLATSRHHHYKPHQYGGRGHSRPSPYHPSHPLYRTASSSSSSSSSRFSYIFDRLHDLAQSKSVLLGLLALTLVCIALLLLLLQPALLASTSTSTGSTSGGFFSGLSFTISSRSQSARRAPSPDELDNAWFNERDRQRGRTPTFLQEEASSLYTTHQLVGDEEAPQDEDAEVDESYKHRNYPFLLHNALPRVAKDNTVIMVIANAGYLEMLLNWKASVDKLNITNYLIIPVDFQMAQELSYLGVNWAYDPEIGLDAVSESVAFTTNKKNANYAKWNKVVHKKSHYFRRILELGYNVMVSDIDMVWMKNPFTIMADKSVDLYFINDWDKPAGHKNPLICGGLYYAQSNKKSLAFIDHVIDCEENLDKKEQYCLNMWYEALIGKPKKGNEIAIFSSERPNYVVMKADDFPSGGYYFSRQWLQKTQKPRPFIIHNNWIVGKQRKIDRFRAFGLWLVDADKLSMLMKNFRLDKPQTPRGRGHEGEAADELMVYYSEMRNRYGKFDDDMWRLATSLPEPAETEELLPIADTTDSRQTPESVADVPVTKRQAPKTTKKQKKPKKASATPLRGIPRNPNYKHVDGAFNPDYRR